MDANLAKEKDIQRIGQALQTIGRMAKIWSSRDLGITVNLGITVKVYQYM